MQRLIKIPQNLTFYSRVAWGILVFIIVVPIFSKQIYAQEIDFGDYGNYTVTLSQLNTGENLEFGTLVQNEGSKIIERSEAKILTIEGVNYLDVIVDVTADQYLLLDGDTGCQTDTSCRIPYTLQSAYNNRNQNDANSATEMTVSSNVASAQFPILWRGANQPPGPPPTPVYEGYDPAAHNETAYLYVYGSINVGNVDAGSYTAEITVTVNYD